MKTNIGRLRRLIRETLTSLTDDTGALAADVCRVCKGRGDVAGEFCATCGGSGEELAYGATRPGIGRGPLPQSK